VNSGATNSLPAGRDDHREGEPILSLAIERLNSTRAAVKQQRRKAMAASGCDHDRVHGGAPWWNRD
jgi:hypothetical protein